MYKYGIILKCIYIISPQNIHTAGTSGKSILVKVEYKAYFYVPFDNGWGILCELSIILQNRCRCIYIISPQNIHTAGTSGKSILVKVEYKAYFYVPFDNSWGILCELSIILQNRCRCIRQIEVSHLI